MTLSSSGARRVSYGAEDAERILDGLLPPSPDRHIALKTRGLQCLVGHVDNRAPFFYNGLVLVVAFKRIAPGLYRVWMEERK